MHIFTATEVEDFKLVEQFSATRCTLEQKGLTTAVTYAKSLFSASSSSSSGGVVPHAPAPAKALQDRVEPGAKRQRVADAKESTPVPANAVKEPLMDMASLKLDSNGVFQVPKGTPLVIQDFAHVQALLAAMQSSAAKQASLVTEKELPRFEDVSDAGDAALTKQDQISEGVAALKGASAETTGTRRRLSKKQTKVEASDDEFNIEVPPPEAT